MCLNVGVWCFVVLATCLLVGFGWLLVVGGFPVCLIGLL